MVQWRRGVQKIGFPILVKPHLFMNLDRFVAGRIHQMQSHKSYLCAHLSWMGPNQDPLCPHCEEADETFSHAILFCSAKTTMIKEFLPSVADIMAFWSLQTLLLQLLKFIHTSHTSFPVKNHPAVSLLVSLDSSSLSSISSSLFCFVF